MLQEALRYKLVYPSSSQEKKRKTQRGVKSKYNETMGALAYQWKENNVDLTDASATTNRLGITRGQQDEPYIYTVVVTNETDGCSTTSDPYYVYVNDSVIVEVTSTVDSICVGGEVTFTANLGDYNSNIFLFGNSNCVRYF